MQKPKLTPLHIMYPKDVTAGEMLEVAERLSMLPFLHPLFPFSHPVTVAGKNQLRWEAYADNSIRFEELDELAEMLGADWELNTSTNKITMTRKGGDDEGTDEDDQPEAA